MKSTLTLLAIPLFAFLAASATLDPGKYLAFFSEADTTAYLAAKSIAVDGDLAYSSKDSDRFLKKYGQRPFRFRLVLKKVLSSKGTYLEFPVFCLPEIFVFALVPFVWAFDFSGWLVLHVLCIGVLFWLGTSFYKPGGEDPKWAAVNAILYYTLILVPVMFLMPTHHLFLLTVITAAIYFGLKGFPIVSAILIAIAFSSQPWALLVALFLISYWKFSGLQGETARFIVTLIVACGVVFGIEWLMYPLSSISETRWITNAPPVPVKEVWSTLPVFRKELLTAPSLQRLSEFIFGRTAGFMAYATIALCLILASIWNLRDRLTNRGLLFTILVLVIVPFVSFKGRSLAYFTDDFAIFLCAVAFFLSPMVRPQWFLIVTLVFSLIFAAPLLINPLGALSSRIYYLQSFPYKYLPQELEFIGVHGLTSDPSYRMKFPGGILFLLNQYFYHEDDFIWLRGESTLEFVIELDSPNSISHLKIDNGVSENRVRIILAGREEFFPMKAGETSYLDLSGFKSRFVTYRGKYYLHGKIHSGSGYVPKLLSRENADYRYLGCRIQPFKHQ
ncbi:MAG TPA: hypothetical protein VLH08_20230 [Acidobacteriota bacterium]|nr:hypothetical protein [Acidobacteriota bacterium]